MKNPNEAKGHALLQDRGKIQHANDQNSKIFNTGKFGIETYVFGPEKSIGDVYLTL